MHAGLGILDELEPLNSELEGLYGIALRVRIGIHSGVVVAGEMGAGGTRQPLAIVGETPHIAQRLESIARPGTVLISDATLDLVAGHFGGARGCDAPSQGGGRHRQDPPRPGAGGSLEPGSGTVQVWPCSAHHRTTMLHPVVRFLEHEWRLAGGASPAPVALDRVADLCDWFGPACHLPDLVRARNLLAVEPTA